MKISHAIGAVGFLSFAFLGGALIACSGATESTGSSDSDLTRAASTAPATSASPSPAASSSDNTGEKCAYLVNNTTDYNTCTQCCDGYLVGQVPAGSIPYCMDECRYCLYHPTEAPRCTNLLGLGLDAGVATFSSAQ